MLQPRLWFQQCYICYSVDSVFRNVTNATTKGSGFQECYIMLQPRLCFQECYIMLQPRLCFQECYIMLQPRQQAGAMSPILQPSGGQSCSKVMSPILHPQQQPAQSCSSQWQYSRVQE